MKMLTAAALALACASLPGAASAMTRDDARMTLGNRAAIADPDEHLERLAAAGATDNQSHAKPRRSARNVLRDDPWLRSAFGWIDNK